MWLVKPGFCVLLAAVSVITRVRPVRGASSDGSVTSSCLCLEKAVDELYNPVEYLAIRRRDSLLSLVVEQRGVIRAFLEDDRERQQVFMDITDRVTTNHTQGEERGLLSVALHPDYSQRGNGRLFAYYITTVSGQDYAYVSEFQVNSDVVDVTSERQLLRMKQLSNRGNGGQLLFGDDGYLYIFTGDGSGHDDLAGRAQDPRSFLGKALRVDVNKQRFEPGDSASAYLYDTPNSNISFGDREGRPEVFALGFRNPWRCSQDKKSRGGTGDIFCGDAGTDLFEEVNIVREGRNYGWNLKEGTQCFNAANCSQLKDGEDPIYSYPHSPDWGNAVVGGFVYRGARFPALTGHYVFGDAVTGETFLLKKDGEGRWGSREWPLCDKTSCPCNARHTKLPFLLAFGLHTDGELMMMMSSEFSVLRPKGILFRVFPPSKPDKVPATCGSCCLTSTPMLSLIPAMVVSLVWHVLHACHVQLW